MNLTALDQRVLIAMATEHTSLDADDCARHLGITLGQAGAALHALDREGLVTEVTERRADGTVDHWGTFNITPKGTRLGRRLAGEP